MTATLTLSPEGPMIQLDGSQQPFIEVPTLDGEAIRLTWVPEGPATPGWAGEPRIRISKVGMDHHVFPGPEVPLSCVSDFIRAAVELMLEVAPGMSR
jgi:hypothetical protein